jgi:hypothetical protein
MDQDAERVTENTQRKRLIITYLRRYSWRAAALTLVLSITLPLARSLQAAPALVPPTSSCATLAALDPTATNGPAWGRTILKGFGAPDGWFGVDVCANGSSAINVSCDKTPTNWSAYGCAPGQPTRDGYGWTFQCPELIERFGAWAFGDNPDAWGARAGGDAPNLWLDGNHPSTYVMYPNGSTHAPVAGDVLVWGYLDSAGRPWPAGPYGNDSGHVAVVAAVHHGLVITAEENVDWGGQDHPSDTLALTATPTGWVLSGSTTPATTLPTYRWQRTMGVSRATYGWLHSTKNTGRFQKTGAAPAIPPPPPPSLSNAAIVTEGGTLVDLAWTQPQTAPDALFLDPPVAATRRLGAPPGVTLRADLAPATFLTADSRAIYAVDTDGHLQEARTASNYLGVVWSGLDAPPGVRLIGSPSVVAFADGALVAALGDDGAVWWRSGTPGAFTPWASLGHPAMTTLTGSALTLALPGTSQILAVALGVDGRLYEAQWRDYSGSGDESAHTRGWTAWSPVETTVNEKGPKPIRFTSAAPLVATVEPGGAAPNSTTQLGPMIDLFALDDSGLITWLRGPGDPSAWRARTVDIPGGANALLGATTLDGFLGATTLSRIEHVYMTTDHGVSMAALAIPANDPAALPQISWTQFAKQDKATQALIVGSALQVGPGASALLIAAGDHALAAATPDAIGVLSGASAADTAGLPAPAADAPTWFDAGGAVAGKPFSDSFITTTLDARWQIAPATAHALATSSGARLASQPDGAPASLTQAAMATDSSLRVKVSGLGEGARAGLTLRYGESDWLTLTTDRAGGVQLCPSVNQKPGACQSAQLTPGAGGAIWLDLTRSGALFLGGVSADGAVWKQVGVWTAPAPPLAPQIVAPSDAAPGVWLPFTCAGLLVSGAPDVTTAPVFTDLKVVAARPDVTGA